jgi:alpha-amylase
MSLRLAASFAAAALLATAPIDAQRTAPQAASSPPAWTRGATCYEIFVRSFFDSDGDGVGDLNGLTSKLDYVNNGNPDDASDLGAQCIWVMPVAASPSYHGYDVTNYYTINPEYGTNDDFVRFVAEAHRRGIKVLVDMVLNHTSSEHPFFQSAALYPDSPYRDWYLWQPKHPGVRNPWGGDNWHRSPYADEYYYGLFWSGMPDLNVENREVLEEAKRIATFWLNEMGVDGFRLDAIRHLVEGDTGRIAANHPATHDVLREYAAHVRQTKPDAFTIGEVWDSIAATLPYYPDQLDSHFAFQVADAIIDAVRSGSAKGLLPPVLLLQREVPAHRWSPFLRNHDQTRTLTELRGDVTRAKLAATILLTMPGMPFVYYGEEIGMTGDKPDPRLRTPMHWSRGPAAGFTTGVPWAPLRPDSLTANVEVQHGDSASLLTLYRTLIHLRAAHPALGAGELVPLTTSTDAVAAFVRRDGDRAVLVVANVSDAPVQGASLTTTDRVLARGTYAVANLLGGPAGSALRVGGGGTIRDYAPLGTLAPLQAYVFDLVPRAGSR